MSLEAYKKRLGAAWPCSDGRHPWPEPRVRDETVESEQKPTGESKNEGKPKGEQ